MKLIAQLAWLAFLPFLSGCFTCETLDAAKGKISEVSVYDSTDRIEKAGVTKDNQLCIFFEKDLTNSPKASRFSLAIPLARIQTNAQYHDEAVSSDHRSVEFSPRRDHPGYIRTKYWTLGVPGGTIRKNWTLLKNSKSDLKFIPTGTSLTPAGRDWTSLHGENFVLISNATQTVYLTRTRPIEFVYVDALTNQPYTIVAVDPTVISKRHRHLGYYALLPLAIPADIVLSPYYAFVLIMLEAHGPRLE